VALPVKFVSSGDNNQTHTKMYDLHILGHTLAGVTTNDIEAMTMARPTKWTLEAIQAEAAKYATRPAFSKGSNTAYVAACRRKLLNQVCAHTETGPAPWTEERIRAEAAKYTVWSDFYEQSLPAYMAAQRKGMLDTIKAGMVTTTRWTAESVQVEASRYDSASTKVISSEVGRFKRQAQKGGGSLCHES